MDLFFASIESCKFGFCLVSAEETKFYNSDLFVPTKHATFNPNIYSDDVGYALFNNSTRVQNKDIKS